jgi:hypothetical protein
VGYVSNERHCDAGLERTPGAVLNHRTSVFDGRRRVGEIVGNLLVGIDRSIGPKPTLVELCDTRIDDGPTGVNDRRSSGQIGTFKRGDRTSHVSRLPTLPRTSTVGN